MIEKLCCICQKPYHPRSWKEDFCNKCYHQFHEAIMNKEPWIKVCISTERKRRNQDKYMVDGVIKTVQFVWLGDDDICEEGGEFRVVCKFDNEVSEK